MRANRLCLAQIDVKLAQPRSQREGNFSNDSSSTARSAYGGGYQSPGAGYGTTPTTTSGASGNTAFDPQALANLYTRMITQMGGMNPMMGTGMNPMMGGMPGAGYGGPMAPGMRMPTMAGPMAGAGMMAGMGMNMNPAMMGRASGIGTPGMMGASINPNIPRGPRGAPAGPGGAVGPQRAGQRGQHNYHPYAR